MAKHRQPRSNSASGGKSGKPAAATAWEGQAAWYDERHGAGGDRLHSEVVLPAVLRQLAAAPGDRILDCCCGQGVLARLLASQGNSVVGVDAAPALIASAKERAGPAEQYLLGDARDLAAVLDGSSFNHAAVVLALQDLDPIEPVLAGIAQHVAPGGRLVLVMTHPAFRIPKQARFGWDEQRSIQYRRIDGYLQPRSVPISTRPGQDAELASTSFHRPLSHYLNALGAEGWGVVACEELCSPKRGSAGRKQEAEERAAREFPMFLVLTAQRLG
ncbi:MAG: methyltransferase domain-containing protein [Planctomycetota bacterium]|jgi:SAM-dependent methyltransferase|nr:methyltransferase domain-containing protein [Planctomycetota bacterium]